MGIWGVINDYSAGDASLRMKDATVRVVTIGDISFVYFTALLGVYGAPFRIPSAGKYYGILFEVITIAVLILNTVVTVDIFYF